MKKLLHIIKGWGKAKGFISVSTAEKKLSEMRLAICCKCSFAKPSKVLKILNGDANYENQLQCMKCKCPCLEKSLVVDESCPISRW